MAINRVRIATGANQPFAATAVIPGLVSGEVTRVDAQFKPKEQPSVTEAQRHIVLVYKPPGTPPDAPLANDFYTRTGSPFTIAFVQRVNGVDKQHVYSALLVKTILKIEDADVTTHTCIFEPDAESLKAIIAAEYPIP